MLTVSITIKCVERNSQSPTEPNYTHKNRESFEWESQKTCTVGEMHKLARNHYNVTRNRNTYMSLHNRDKLYEVPIGLLHENKSNKKPCSCTFFIQGLLHTLHFRALSCRKKMVQMRISFTIQLCHG